MKRIKKILKIGICLTIAFIASDINQKIFIINPDQLLPLLFTLLGLCITAYTFISTPINELVKENKTQSIKESLKNMLKGFEDDMLLIFLLAIIIIVLDILINTDIPIFKDTQIQLFNVISLKLFICNFFIAFSAMLSFYGLYDLIKATFRLLKKSFEI